MKAEDILEAARRRRESDQVETEYQDILRVSLDNEWYGIDIANVVEVRECPKVFSIPHTPDYIVGVVNLRGEILSIMDIRKLLGLSTASDDQKHIVVIEKDSIKVGIRVNRADSVMTIPESDIKALMSTTDKARGFVAGETQFRGEVIAVLNLDALIELEDTV